jgi:translation initiation factor 5B
VSKLVDLTLERRRNLPTTKRRRAAARILKKPRQVTPIIRQNRSNIS